MCFSQASASNEPYKFTGAKCSNLTGKGGRTEVSDCFPPAPSALFGKGREPCSNVISLTPIIKHSQATALSPLAELALIS